MKETEPKYGAGWFELVKAMALVGAMATGIIFAAVLLVLFSVVG